MNATLKHYYNTQHMSLTLNTMIYLCLFHSYIISELANCKLFNQCIELFHILEWIDFLVYCLKLLSMMCIHSVVLITQLESASANDFYNCQSDMNLLSVENKLISDDVESFSYEIKQLLDKHITHQECSQSTVKYLVKWKEYNHSHNVWYDIKNLKKMKDLVNNYEQWQINRA